MTETQNAKKGFALSGLLVGIGAFLIGFLPFIGLLVGMAGIALCVVGLAKKQSKGMAVTGLVLASIATLTSLVVTIVISTDASTTIADKPTQVIAPPVVWEGSGGETITAEHAFQGDFTLELETHGECFYTGLLKRDKINTTLSVNATKAGVQQFNVEGLDGNYYFVMTTRDDSTCSWVATMSQGTTDSPVLEPTIDAEKYKIKWFHSSFGFDYNSNAYWLPCDAGQCIQIRVKAYTPCTHGIEMGILPMNQNGESADGVTASRPEGLNTGEEAILTFSTPGTEATSWLPYDLTCYP